MPNIPWYKTKEVRIARQSYDHFTVQRSGKYEGAEKSPRNYHSAQAIHDIYKHLKKLESQGKLEKLSVSKPAMRDIEQFKSHHSREYFDKCIKNHLKKETSNSSSV